MTAFGVRGDLTVPGLRVARVFVPPLRLADVHDQLGALADACQSAAARDLAAGRLVLLSFKLDPAEVMMGLWDAQLAGLASWAVMATGNRVALIYWHEPENDHDALAWTAAFTRVRSVIGDAAPGVPVGCVAMAYQWRPGAASTQDGDAWWVDADFYGVDVYSGPDDADVVPYWMDAGFARWWEYIGARAVGIKRWWLLAERGFRGAEDAAAASVVHAEWERLAVAPAPPVAYVLWASPGAEGDAGLVPGPMTVEAFTDMVAQVGAPDGQRHR